ncbi:hypothetical protein Ciccas_001879 [Cichlidogyrus casuarinus]|uniref:Transcriptional regulator ATRX n=1 Tax=Cichlidogyrus casuarinus TaxID=1844966 RepID=A0ABD2QIW3_9PLAT
MAFYSVQTRSKSSEVSSTSNDSDVVYHLDENTAVKFAKKSLEIRMDDSGSILTSASSKSRLSSTPSSNNKKNSQKQPQSGNKRGEHRKSLALRIPDKLTLSDSNSDKSKQNGSSFRITRSKQDNEDEESSSKSATLSSRSTRSKTRLNGNKTEEEEEASSLSSGNEFVSPKKQKQSSSKKRPTHLDSDEESDTGRKKSSSTKLNGKKTESSSVSMEEEDENSDEVEELESKTTHSSRRSKRSIKSPSRFKDRSEEVVLSSSSGDEFLTPKKQKKKRNNKRLNDSDDESADEAEEHSSDSDDSSSESYGSKSKKKRVAAVLKNSKKQRSVVIEDEDEENSSPKRKIRKIIDKDKLSRDTKSAELEEKERRKRIEERQNLYNSFVITDVGSDAKAQSLVLEFEKQGENEKEAAGDTKKEPETKKGKKSKASDQHQAKPLISVEEDFVRQLKPHQMEAVRFLWDCVIESVERNEKNGGGGAILAHCMGLGKTLSTISFLHTCLRYPQLKIKSCLVLCPVNTVLNWANEFEVWVPDEEPLDVFDLVSATQIKDRLSIIAHWSKRGGVMLMGYEMFRNFIRATAKRIKSKEAREQLLANLLDPGPDMIVCDEGHLLKNDKSGLSKCVNAIATRRRIVLTGTPLQNNLNEYQSDHPDKTIQSLQLASSSFLRDQLEHPAFTKDALNWTMVNFVKPNLLGTLKEFANRFINPIKNGQHSNSTSQDVKLMKKRAHILYKTLDGCVQRKDYNALTQYLPPRYEYVLKIRISEVQRVFYEKYLRNRTNIQEDGTLGTSADGSRRNMLFNDQQNLYRIWTHPFTMKIQSTREIRRNLLASSSEEEEAEMSDDEASEESDEPELSTSAEDSSVDTTKKKAVTATSRAQQRKLGTTRPRRKSAKHTAILDDNSISLSDNSTLASSKESRNKATTDLVVLSSSNGSSLNEEDDKDFKPKLSSSRIRREEWWRSIYEDSYDYDVSIGGKLEMLLQILKHCSEIGDKVLVFSHSLFSLDLIEKFLCELDIQWRLKQGENPDKHEDKRPSIMQVMSEWQSERPAKLDYDKYFAETGHNTWLPGYDYERMDGSVNPKRRKSLQTRFNKTSNRRLRLFLISTRAGGLGINLVGANRLVLFDVSWNPSHDIQSIFRSYRFGQTKPVYIYRLIAQGTMEEKMYDRQVTKQSLALRVIDEQQIDRHFSETDLAALYSFDPDIWDPDKKRPTPALPKDRLLADMLSNLPELISSHHTHDSLLENREDEGLTESERQEAWKEYEDEKRLGVSIAQHSRSLVTNNYNSMDPALHSNQVQIMRLQQQLLTMQSQQKQLNTVMATFAGENGVQNPWLTNQVVLLREAIKNTEDQLRAMISNQSIMQQQRTQRQANMFNELAQRAIPGTSNPLQQQQQQQPVSIPSMHKPAILQRPSIVPKPTNITTSSNNQPSPVNSKMAERFQDLLSTIQRSRPDLPAHQLETLALNALMNQKSSINLAPRAAPLAQYANRASSNTPKTPAPVPFEDLTGSD